MLIHEHSMCHKQKQKQQKQGDELTSFLARGNNAMVIGISVRDASGLIGMCVDVLAVCHEDGQRLGCLPPPHEGLNGDDDDPDDVEEPIPEDEGHRDEHLHENFADQMKEGRAVLMASHCCFGM